MTPAPEILAAARQAHARWHIPVSVQLAQYGLESGWGRHEPAGSHNPFGIKAKPGVPGVTVTTREEDAHHHSYFTPAVFACFPSEAAAFDAHARLLASARCYAPARACLPDVRRFVELMAPRYATAHDYTSVLWSLIRSSRLLRFDA